jgi:dihydroorotate dehydrogenase electron transfer subunit
MKDFQVKILSNQRIAPECFRMVLAGDFEDFNPQPGQFVMLRIGDGFDPLLRRPFAAFKFKNQKGIFLEIFYKVVGHGTRIMSHLNPEHKLDLLGPLGNGFKIPDKIKAAFIVAGGMGIAPLRGLIYHLVESQIGEIYVFMGARSSPELLFQDTFREMKVSLQVSTEDGSAGHKGLVTEIFSQFLESYQLEEKNDKICFACGPLPMLEALACITSRYQFPCQVSLESRMACGIGACLGCVIKLRNQDHSGKDTERYGRVCLEGPVFDIQEIEW